MAIHIRRREFVVAFGAAAVAWPIAARAQQPGMPVIGWLGSETRQAEDFRVVPFREGLKKTGFVEGQNLALEYRIAGGQYDRLPEMAADLVHRQVSVIALTGLPAALAAKRATATIPIIFQIADDPVQLGLVASLGRPGGNITGVTSLHREVAPKQPLLHELVPNATAMALVVNPANAARAESTTREVQDAAHKLGLELHVLHASGERELDAAFASAVRLRAGAMVIGPDSFFYSFSRSGQLGALALRHAIPAICPYREFATAGGLISYGTSNTDQFRQVGVYTARVLKGEKTADLPVQQATMMELYINLKTAKALGITIPLPLSGRADEVIE